MKQLSKKRLQVLAWWFALTAGYLLAGDAQAGDAEVQFEKEIEPILKQHCFDCHGPDEQESRLRLDRLASMLAGGDSGEPAVVPTKPKSSYLVKLIRHQEPGKEMPPDESLSEDQIGLIEKWIASGAETPTSYGLATAEADLSHWAFQPVEPTDAASLDDFIRGKLVDQGLQLSPTADRRVLIRRLYLVMLGLPPTPQQVDQFLADDRESAWSELVNDVLESPHYGERWASYWLDLVRFGETHGFETNRERPNAWQYRDWVIRSLNADKPYDQFVQEQIVGDAIGAAVGTGFLVAGPYDLVKGQDPLLQLQQRMNELDDMINTTGTAFLGLTTGCARCHSHKFDPISQRDYYAMQAVFAGVQHGDRALPFSKETKAQIAKLAEQIEERTELLKKFIPQPVKASIVLDESEATHAYAPSGTAAKEGQAKTSFGDAKYTWWQNEPDKDVVSYRPGVKGNYRVWLSWGSGFESHSTNARYVIRTAAEDKTIAVVNQQLRADRSRNDGVLRWSGFHDAGVHALTPADSIVLIGGSQGTAVTADVVVLQPVDQAGESDTATVASESDVAAPTKRTAVNAKRNEERFPRRSVRFVRFTIEESLGAEGCIDELEIYSGDRNVALASHGAKATSSGDFVHPKHKLQHINDGQHGNDRSWIVDSKDGGWVQIEFADPVVVDRIVWGRDRTGKFNDRLPVRYHIDGATEPGVWECLASSGDRNLMGGQPNDVYQFTYFSDSEAAAGQRWLDELKRFQKQKADLEKTTTVYAGKFIQPGPTHRLYRGEPGAKREQVGPNAIKAFASLGLPVDAPEQTRRKALADWIADQENPLTARVIVNRLWQFHFGTGIVDTPSDFGRNGAPPSHPELLDYLAAELMDHGWSLKHIHRLILNSATWQQSNRPDQNALRADADSRLLWRFPPRRLEAEAIRDSILAVTGALDLDRIGGPGFSPFEVEMENVRHYHAKSSYGPEDWRRMIYMTKVRQEREHVFGAFDCPDSSMVVSKRSRSTTPLQALNLLNSHFVMQQADLLAARLENEEVTAAEQIQRAWQLCFQRVPTVTESADSLKFIEQEGLRQFTRALLNTNEFVFIP
ncbi:MAG: PSD1 and planctomycete cytochrome C domain-containing protein [Rubripirellula sp.]